MIAVFTGLPGSGKSAKMARTAIELLYRNRKYYEKLLGLYEKDPNNYIFYDQHSDSFKPPVQRKLWTNLKLSTEVEEEFGVFSRENPLGLIVYWTDLRQLTPLRDVDVLIDEIATYFDARLWETLSLEMRRWLAQHRKFGIEIYGTAQDFAQVDKAFRRLTSNLIYLRKMIGTRDLSPTRPAPKFVLVVSLVQELDPTTYDEQKSKFASNGFPGFMLITKKDVGIFDTRAEVKLSKALPLKHIERVCELPNCEFHKTQHV